MGNLLCCEKASAKNKKPDSLEKSSSVKNEQIGFCDSLPWDVEEATIHHVYDGDTVTVTLKSGEQSPVRFFGIDAPELKAKEAYAEESASYMRELCPAGKKIWLKFDGKRTDKYNRLLAYVYVANPSGGSGYLCVNAAMLQAGFAFFYSVKDEQLSNRQMLLSAQRKAIEQRKNLWQTIDLSKTVFCTRNGTAFHDNHCEHVKSYNLTPMKVAAAFDRGLSPCRTCHPV